MAVGVAQDVDVALVLKQVIYFREDGNLGNFLG
jgi:hypothetical protein